MTRPTSPHPIVVQMSPSAEQWPAILQRGQDVVVTAGAGTGKTRTLVARYLSLLAEGLPLRSVVAITFTHKAAREMRNRVRDEIRRYLERADLQVSERQRWQDLYGKLDAARIGTIHSLCAEMLRAHPAEAGLDPHFEVLDEGQATVLRNQAIDEAISWAAEDAGAVQLFALLGEVVLRQVLEELMRRRLEVAQCLSQVPEQPWPVWRPVLVAPILSFVGHKAVRARFAELLELRAEGAIDRAEAAGDRLAGPLRRLLALWNEIEAALRVDDTAAVSRRLAALRSEMKQVGQARNWKPAEPKVAIKELQVLYDASLSDLVGDGIDLSLDMRLADATPALCRLFRQGTAAYVRLKQRLQVQDFDDLEHSALALLERDRSVQTRWQQEVRAILVDEFQDTNSRQRDLVRLLNGDGGKLFIVGDAKQSIYRFRGADVAVFRSERSRIAREGGTDSQLATSYRAHRDLIAGLNDLLRPVLGEEQDLDRPWLEPFAPLLHHREDPGPGFVAPHIEMHLTVGSKTGGALVRAADALAARIEFMVGAKEVQVVVDGQARPLEYGDIAILCRASSSFAAYEDALEKAGVPFLTVAGRGFYGRPEIRDLLNALQVFADPTDDVALVGLLRSPALGLSDATLYQICRHRDTAKTGTSLWSVLRWADIGTWPEEEQPRIARAVSIVEHMQQQAGRISVASLLKAFLDETDYCAALIQAGQSRGARNVRKLLADANASGIVSVGEFLDYVRRLRTGGAHEGEARTTAEGALQIMSIHAAKGLEFPVVVIGDLTYGSGSRGSVLIDPQLGILPPLKADDSLHGGQRRAASAIYRVGQARDSDQDAAEQDRLFYVAATRAREKLILSGYIRLRQDGRPGQLGRWLGKLVDDGGLDLGCPGLEYHNEGAGVNRLNGCIGSTPVSCAIYEPEWVRSAQGQADAPALAKEKPMVQLPPALLEPVALEVELVDQKVSDQERPPPQRVWRVVPAVRRPRAPAWVVGSLVHEALAAWRFPTEQSTQRGGFERWARARARGYGLTDPRQLADAVRQSEALLTRFHVHPLCFEMVAADRRLHEVPYSLQMEGRLENGIIDALYQRQGVWTIVEFKTDAVRDPADLSRLLADQDYVAQSQRYVAAAERLLDQRVQAVLCLLNYAGQVHVHRIDGAS